MPCYKAVLLSIPLATLTLLLLHHHSTPSSTSQQPTPTSPRTPRLLPYSGPDPAFSLTLNPTKKIVLLLTSFRSGSTFLGQLFDQNPTFQYLYEPFFDRMLVRLHTEGKLAGATSRHTLSDLRMLYLQQVMHDCTVYPSPFPAKHGYCGTEQENWVRFNSSSCVRRMLTHTGRSHGEVCRFRDTTVFKVIRLTRLADILRIGGMVVADQVKVVHLVRHPTPMMMSRRRGVMWFGWDMFRALEGEEWDRDQRRTRMAWESFNYCSENMESAKLAETHPWFKGRYLRLSHAELSKNPIGTAQVVYDFVGQELTEGVKDSLSQITKGESEANLKKRGALSFHKDSLEVVERWKNLVSQSVKYWDLYSIEAQCRNLLDAMHEEYSVDPVDMSKLIQIHSNDWKLKS